MQALSVFASIFPLVLDQSFADLGSQSGPNQKHI